MNKEKIESAVTRVNKSLASLVKAIEKNGGTLSQGEIRLIFSTIEANVKTTHGAALTAYSVASLGAKSFSLADVAEAPLSSQSPAAPATVDVVSRSSAEQRGYARLAGEKRKPEADGDVDFIDE